MILIRSVIYFIGLALSTVFYATALSLVGWALSFNTRSRIANHWGKVNLAMQKSICGLNYEVDGWENFPKSNGIVFAKHQSAWETIALRGMLPADQTWVLKRELMWVPFFGWALALLNPIAIDRSSGKKAIRQIVEQGRKSLDQGHWVIVFPEGTRVAPGTRKKYGIGGAILADKTGYPVIPIAHNAGIFWRRRGIKKYPGTVKVVIGPVIDTTELSAGEINQKAEDWIESTVAQLPQTRELENSQ